MKARGSPRGGEYKPGFGWQSLALSAIVIAVACTVLVPADILERIVPGRASFAVLRPDVLVVSASPSYQAAVRQTVQPRGYPVRVAANLEAGVENLRREPGRIGIVIIDSDLAGAKRMASAAKAASPDARIVLLDGHQGAGRISQLLVDAGMD